MPCQEPRRQCLRGFPSGGVVAGTVFDLPAYRHVVVFAPPAPPMPADNAAALPCRARRIPPRAPYASVAGVHTWRLRGSPPVSDGATVRTAARSSQRQPGWQDCPRKEELSTRAQDAMNSAQGHKYLIAGLEMVQSRAGHHDIERLVGERQLPDISRDCQKLRMAGSRGGQD
jgi:hypothetical protein